MPSANARRAVVRRTPITGTKIPDTLATLDGVCSAGAKSKEVQGSAVASGALANLAAVVQAGHASLSSKLALAQALLAAAKALQLDVGAIKMALLTYEAAVEVVANGDAGVITRAGLPSRAPKAPSAALSKVALVRTKPGKHAAEAILSWPRGPGATAYAVEVNLTPTDLGGPFVALGVASNRRRVVKTPTPGSQLLARVASVSCDGRQSEWSDVVLVTTR